MKNMSQKKVIQPKNIRYVFATSLVFLFVILYGALLVYNVSFAGVSGDGNFTIEPVVTGHDDVIGKTGRDWKFTVHTTAELVLGDVIKFIFPSGLETTDFDLSGATQSAISGVALYDIAEESTSYGSDVLTDGGMEDWLMEVDNFDIDDMGSTPVAKSTDSHGGTYAALLTADFNMGGVYISNPMTNSASYDSLETIQAKLYAKRVTGTANILVLYSCYIGEASYYYNFSGDNAGTWTIAGGGPSGDQMETLTATSSYTQLTSTQVTSPDGGSIGHITVFASSTNSGDTILIDDFEEYIATVDEAVNGTFEAWTASENYLTNWFDSYWTDGGETEEIPQIERNSVNVQAGTYATSLGSNHTVANNDAYVGQNFSGVFGDNYRLSFYAKSQDIGATVTSSLSFFNGNPSTATQYYNFSTNHWDDYTKVSTIPDSDHRQDDSLTTGFQQLTFENTGLVVPESGIITPVISAMVDTGWTETTKSVMVVDTVSMEKGTTTTPTAGVAFNASAPTVVYGMATETISAETDFYITIGGITNGTATGSNVNNLTWQVVAGTPTSSAEPYGTLSSTKFSFSADDNLIIPGITADAPPTPVATEGGSTGSYSFYLKTQPTADVTVTVTPDAQITVSPTTLVFTSANWSTPQTVTVTAVDDHIDEESEHTGLITHSIASDDADYDGATVSNVTATITDNDTAGIAKSEIALAVTENSTTDAYTVVLDTEPTANVIVSLSASSSLATLSTSTLTFTSANWSDAQAVTVSRADNDTVDGELTDYIIHAVSSTDTNYDEFSVANVTVTITDNDTAGIAKSEIALAVTENSTTDAYTVVLDTEPTANVIVSLSASSSLATLSTSTLTFTSANWSDAQAVTVSRADNDTVDGELTDYIIHAVSSTDTNYDEYPIANITVTITDDDTAGVTNSETAIAVTEGSTTDTYTVVLDTEPTANVVITPSATGSEVTFSASTLTFTSENWSTPQTLTITAVDDSDIEGAHADTITHTAVSDDTNYGGATIADVTVTITDNDDAGRRNTSGSSSGSAPVVVLPPSAPTTVALSTVQPTIIANTPTVVFVGNVSHTVTAGTPNANGSVLITVQSDPITTTMFVGEEKLLDTDEDGENDLFLRLDEVIGNTVKLTISAIADLEFSINQALSTTDSQDVTLYFNSPDATLMAISNSAFFDNISYENYSATKDWHLTDGIGLKTVYVKLRTSNGGTKTISDTITLIEPATEDTNESKNIINCALTTGSAYKLASSPAVFYITNSCTKRPFKTPEIFFTYFNSWNDVQTTTAVLLDSIENDSINFMPWGPNYDPKYGALVKIVTDPKVYLLLGTEKYWITSETVFNSLNYSWNWIEDVAESLLDKYTVGSAITNLEHHPNYTLIMYENDAKVYRLEPDLADSNKQVKRWIVNETVFNDLNFRWDRIVTIGNEEAYTTGLNLSE